MFTMKLTAKEIALTICFTALYVVSGFLAISPLIGLPGKTITTAAIMALIMGTTLGPYIGTLSTILGGIVGFFLGSFSLPSFFSGVFAALCAGMLYTGKRNLCAFTYFSLLLLFGFYPLVGPVWLYLPLMWFQIAGFLILISPLQSIAEKEFNSDNNSKLLLAFFTTFLTSTLAGQIAGSLTIVVLIPDVNFWKANWPLLTFLYPVERTIIALAATLVGTPLKKILRSTNLIRTSNLVKHHKCI